jgi:hypothetical protein
VQPTAYVITQRDRSHPVLAECLRSLAQWSWPYEIHAAVCAPSLAQWRALGINMLTDRGKMQYRPGAQGCWHSHYQLWLKARDSARSIIVLEHDVVVTGSWDPLLNSETDLIKLYTACKTKVNTVTGRWSMGAHAYLLTPANADRLIEHARLHGAQALDKHLGDLVVPWRFLDRDLVRLNPRRGSSTTSPIRR